MKELGKYKSDIKEKKLHFNKHEFFKILEKSKTDPYGSLVDYYHYFEKYPDDNSARTYYIANLITVGQFEKAEEEIRKVEIELGRNSLYHYDVERATHLMHNLKIDKLKLYIYQDRKEEAIELYASNIEEFSYLGKEVLLYLKRIIGTLGEDRRKQNSYIFRQLVEYRKEDFLDHLKKHLADFNRNDRRISVSFFSPDFPIRKVLNEVEKYIPSRKGLHFGFIDESYYFKYDQCGRDYNRIVDYFKVVTFNNTRNFITMCPTDCGEKFPFVDLNYLKEVEKPRLLEKRPSQIDKFKQRYNIK